jgi:hypothetical protein
MQRINQGWYRNLWVELNSDRRPFALEVRLVVHFHFRVPDPVPRSVRAWTSGEMDAWKSDFRDLVETRWSHQHPLYADFIDAYRAGDATLSPRIDPRRLTTDVPSADVQLRVIDADDRRQSIPSGQVSHDIHIWRGVDTGTAHASAFERVAALRENALEALESDSGRQTAALHEVGHLLGLVHSGCPSHIQSSSTDLAVMNLDECYGRDGAEMSSVMGSGDTIRPRDYVIFAYIMRRLVPEWLWFARTARAEAQGGRLASFDRGLISPTQDAVGPTPGVLSRSAIYPSLEVRESRGRA